MSITPDQLQTIRTEFSRLPPRVRLESSHPLTVREAIFALGVQSRYEVVWFCMKKFRLFCPCLHNELIESQSA